MELLASNSGPSREWSFSWVRMVRFEIVWLRGLGVRNQAVW
jgi:hypothetical protein